MVENDRPVYMDVLLLTAIGGENDKRVPFPGEYVTRKAEPELPGTVTTLYTAENGVVHLVGTAHFSEQSQDDVTKVPLFILWCI